MPIVRFGAGDSQEYDFTRAFVLVQEYRDNFTDLQSRTITFPGMDGAFDVYGNVRAPQPIGTVTQRIVLDAQDRSEMEALRDEIKGIVEWGRQRLWFQPSDDDLPPRYCYAKAINVRADREDHKHTDLQQPVSITWEVTYPRWLAPGSELTEWGFPWGSPWGNDGFAASGTLTEETITISSNGMTQPRIVITCGAAETCEDPTIQRIVGGVVVDEVSYTGVIGNNEVLEINGRGWSVTLDGNDAYTTDFEFLHPAWFRLAPGDNLIRVIFANGGDDATIQMFYNEVYF